MSQYQSENRNLKNQVVTLQREIDDSRAAIDDLEEKIAKAGSIISALEAQNDDLKRHASDLENQTDRAETQAR